jgi:hypothetical protein
MEADEISTFAHASAYERLKIIVRKARWLQWLLTIIALVSLAFITERIGYHVGSAQTQDELITQHGTEALDKLNHSYATLLRLANDIQGLQLPGDAKNQLLQDITQLKTENGDVWVTLATIVQVVNPNAKIERKLSDLLIGSAYAQEPPLRQLNVPLPQRRLSDETRTWIMLIVFATLGVTFIVSIISIFKSTNPDVLKFAIDTVKTLLGFFIGVATTLLGTT